MEGCVCVCFCRRHDRILTIRELPYGILDDCVFCDNDIHGDNHCPSDDHDDDHDTSLELTVLVGEQRGNVTLAATPIPSIE